MPAFEDNQVELPPIAAATEAPEPAPRPSDGRDRRIGFAVVGLGRLSLGQILPAFGKTKHCRLAALVSGDRDKAMKLARQYDVPESSLLDYDHIGQLSQHPDVQVVYIVLPNSLHARFTIAAARAGKHVLCEKPMAPTVAECEQMIDECQRASVRLMVAYRSQYEPLDRALVKMVRDGRLGTLKSFVTSNAIHAGDPGQWRLKRALAGGGTMPDVGIYGLNAARFLSGEEPSEVSALTWSTPGDARFAEVEESIQFLLRFPSGFQATCHASYGQHRSQFFRLAGTSGWAEMDPAYGYGGLKLRVSTVVDGREVESTPVIAAQDQFALEMDHMALCVRDGREPLTGGREGLQDVRLIEALYQSARDGGRVVHVEVPTRPLRGPMLGDDE